MPRNSFFLTAMVQPSRLILTLVTAASFHVSGLAAPPPRLHITDIGPAHIAFAGRGQALNNHGDAVLVVPNADGALALAQYRDGSLSEIFLPLASEGGGNGYDINDHGVIVGNTSIGRENVGYMLAEDGFINLNEETGEEIEVISINNEGVILIRRWDGLNSELATWHDGQLRSLAHLTAGGGVDINNLGEILLRYYSDQPPIVGYYAGILGLDGSEIILEGLIPEDFNDAGHVIGGNFSGSVFLYRPEEIITLRPLRGDIYARARKINNRDEIIGESEDSDDHTRPFLFRNGKTYDPNRLIPRRSGWEILGISDINDHGQMIGHGRRAGQRRSILLTPERPRRR